MGATDTYEIKATITGEYEDDPMLDWSWTEYLAPGQEYRDTMASVMRSAALELAPEQGDSRSEEAIYAALDGVRAATLKESVGPATRDVILARLWELAGLLNVEWYGMGQPVASGEKQERKEPHGD